ncbi:MAG TPA: UDP-N-acetylglucosamine 2-epimerase (non-hydrolyzing) [Candidatus Paceibacterota bacterium]|nr:UDP-N-acetylglucosamine 2-epimerase (non-hydrolyzing) [Candidatus Paceibacterota bacterium]
MKVKKISVVIGTRPQIIKSQPLILSLKSKFEVDVIYTGQHYDYELSKKFFKDLKLSKPNHNLGVGKGSAIQQISKIILKLEKIFSKSRPDLVIVPGDTTSAVAGAIAASKMKIKLVHLEAGARSNQFYMAEEVNRRIIDHCSDILFAPTKGCLENLKNELVFGESYFVGDTMYDLFLKFYKKHDFASFKKKTKSNQILITIHRAENIENKNNLKKISEIINNLNKKGFSIIFPVHPHTERKIKEFGFDILAKKMPPIGYIDLMKIMAESKLVMTDSGGLQKEAYWMGKPCVTFRENTEWVETLSAKANFLMPLSKKVSIEKIIKISKLKINPKSSLYGKGNASERISQIISRI